MSDIPFDIEAEAGALGCVLCADGRQAAQLLDRMEVQHFHDQRHVAIFRALLDCNEDGESLTESSLYQRLKAGKPELAAYSTTLADKAPTAGNLDYWIKTLTDRAERRAMLRDAGNLIARANDLTLPVEPRAKNNLPRIIDGADFESQELPLPPEIIHGVLYQGAKLGVGGGSKSFKSWILLNLVLCVSHNVPWLGREVTPGNVVYVNFELQPFILQRRFRRVAKAMDLEIKPHRYFVLNLRGFAMGYETLLPLIQQSCNELKFTTLVLDPTYKLLGNADENSSRDMANLFNALERFAQKTKAALIFSSHFSKGNQSQKSSMDRISGSGVYGRDPDAVMTFTEMDETNAYSVTTDLRDFAPLAPFAVQWDFPLMKLAPDLDPAQLKQNDKDSRKKFSDVEICSAISDRAESNPISISEWAALLDMKRTTLIRYCDQLRAKGWIKTQGEGNKARQYLTTLALESLEK